MDDQKLWSLFSSPIRLNHIDRSPTACFDQEGSRMREEEIRFEVWDIAESEISFEFMN